jgi:hypothetical protein
MMAHVLAGGAEAQGEVGFVDRWHNVGAGVNKGAIEVIAGWRNVTRL